MIAQLRAPFAAIIAALCLAAPAGAGPGADPGVGPGVGAGADAMASDLPGTAWGVRAAIAVRATAGGNSITDRKKLEGIGTVTFAEGRFIIVDDEGEDLAGEFNVDAVRPSRFSGLLDEGATAELDDDLEQKLARQLRRELGKGAKLDFAARPAQVRGRLKRGGRRLSMTVKLRYDASVRFRGRSVRLRVAAKFRLRGKPLAQAQE